ncbi:hypothetical protein QEN19_000291 [Hanseniaspora menglaensis]
MEDTKPSTKDNQPENSEHKATDVSATNHQKLNENYNPIAANNAIAAVNALNNAAVVQESSAAHIQTQKPLVTGPLNARATNNITVENFMAGRNGSVESKKLLPNDTHVSVINKNTGHDIENDDHSNTASNGQSQESLALITRETGKNTSALTAANTVAAASVEKFKQNIRSFSNGQDDLSSTAENNNLYSKDDKLKQVETEKYIKNSVQNFNTAHDFTPLQIISKQQSKPDVSSAYQQTLDENALETLPETNTGDFYLEQEQQSESAPQDNEDEMYRPLNVKDALSYLEEVKIQFYNRPAVYNSFLDIMKEFKAQTIDTPGVIERVSTLFTEYPLLIQGFNTFLPQGYKIEYSNVPGDPFPVKVVTPYSGGAVELNAGVLHAQQQEAKKQEVVDEPQVSAKQHTSEPQIIQNQSYEELSQNNQLPVPNEISEDQQQHGDVEFSHAISYVNKIKTRFSAEPHVYKQFLEILQTYQTDQKPIQEVYEQVTVLFQGAPDLLDDFKNFLPDTNQELQYNQQQVSQQQFLQGSPNVVEQFDNHYLSHNNGTQQMPTLGSFSPPKQPQSLDANILNEEQQHNMIAENGGHLIAAPGNMDIPISNTRGELLYEDNIQKKDQQVYEEQKTVQFDNNIAMQQQQLIMERPEIDLDPSLVPVIPEPLEPVESELEINDEVHFFEKVKKLLGSKQIYQEFVKLLNLYTQDLISKNDLIRKVAHFIGAEPELFEWFKLFVGYEELPKEIENIVYEKHKVDLDLCEACGPSYKKLPKSDTFMPCSGRDEMCWEVLNDEWVGHPVWASEESGFIAHRKNQYEETLFKTEEERHEYDFYIEANLRTIQTLEVINNRITSMSQAEKASFRLPEGLGATSMTIYKKVIRKIYEKERGFEIIEALHEHPAQTVPVVLNRLKQKDEEWRRNQREWNKIWREVEQKVYYKSLDHMGLTFKQTDKKLLLTKQLLADVCSIKEDPLSKENVGNAGSSKRWNPLISKSTEELKYKFSDKNIIFDILFLCRIYIVDVSAYSQSDKEKIQRFLYWFVSNFFNIEMHTLLEFTISEEKIDVFTHNREPDNSNQTDIGQKRSRTLLDNHLDIFDSLYSFADIFKINSSKQPYEKHEPQGLEEDDSSKTTDSESYESFKDNVLKSWLGDDADKSINDFNEDCGFRADHRNRFISYGNTQIYLLVRIFSIIYERLLEIKQVDVAVTKEINKRKYDDYIDPMFLSSKQLEDKGLSFEGDSAYSKLIGLSSEFIQGKIESQWFEESIRQAYKNRAFKLITIDKTIQHLIKQCQNCTTDKKSQSLMKLFETDRQNSCLKISDQVIYRMQSRKILDGNDLMFSFDFNYDLSELSINYIRVDDLPSHKAETKVSDERWKSYVASYKLSYATEGSAATVSSDIVFEKNDVSDQTDNKSASESIVDKTKINLNISKDDYKLSLKKDSSSIFIQSADNHTVSSLKDTKPVSVTHWLEKKKLSSLNENTSLSTE